MARMRFTHSTLTSGYINKSARGNVDSERYNNALTECTNFYISESGGCFKRPGTTFVSIINNNKADYSTMITSKNGELLVVNKSSILRVDFSKEIPSTFLSSFNAECLEISRDTKYCILEKNKILFALKNGLYEFVYNYLPNASQELKLFSFVYPPMSFPDTSYGLLIEFLTKTMISCVAIYRIESKTLCDNVMVNPKNIVPPVSVLNNSTISGAQKIAVVLDGKRFLLQQNTDKKWQLLGYLSDALSFQDNCMIYINGKSPSMKWTNSSKKKCRYTTALSWGIDVFYKYKQHYKIVSAYEGRLFLANIGEVPTGVWASSLASDQFMNFDIGQGEITDGLQFKINTKYADEILWLAPHTKLIAGTSSGIYAIGAMSFNDEPISPTNCRAKFLSSVGASSLQPVSGLDAIFFVDSSGKAVYEISLGQDGGILQVNPLSTLANDLIETKVIAHCWQQNPNKIYWCVLEDGSLCSMTFSRNANIIAWAKHELAGGKAIDIITVPMKDHDRICVIVERNNILYLEYLNNSFEMDCNLNHEHPGYILQNHAVYLDCSITVQCQSQTLGATQTITGLNHLNGQEVTACLDNSHIEKHTVDNNKIELQHQFKESCTVGLSYKSTLQTVPLSGGSVLGSSIGSVGSQKNVVLHLYNSIGGKYGTDDETMYAIPYINKEIKFDTPQPMFTGLIKAPLINSKDILNRSIRIEHDGPTSFNILSIVQDISTSDS